MSGGNETTQRSYSNCDVAKDLGDVASFNKNDSPSYSYAPGYEKEKSYTSKQSYLSTNYSHGTPRTQVPILSDESFEQSIDLSHTRSETEARLQRLQSEVAGLMSRYQVAEDELQSVGQSIGNSSAGRNSQRNNNGYVPQMAAVHVAEDELQSIGQSVGYSSASKSSQPNNNWYAPQVANALNITPPRAPLQYRLDQLHDITPHQVSYTHHQGNVPYDYTPPRMPTQYQAQPNSFHVPVPFRYTYSSVHPGPPGTAMNENHYSLPPHQVPQNLPYLNMQHPNQHFPPIQRTGSQSNRGQNNLSCASSDSNSYISPYESPRISAQSSHVNPSFQGSMQNSIQGTINYHNARPSYAQHAHQRLNQSPHFLSGVPRTPNCSGRQF